MTIALLENLFEQLVFWEKLFALIIALGGSSFIFYKLFSKVFVNIKKANSSVSDFIGIISELKTIVKEFGSGDSSLKASMIRLENSLWHTDQKIKVLTYRIGIAAFEANKNGLYIFVSKKWSELTGIIFEEACGNGWLNMVDEDERDDVYKEWQACIVQGREFHASVKLSGDPDKQVSLIAWPIKNLDGSIERFFGIVI